MVLHYSIYNSNIAMAVGSILHQHSQYLNNYHSCMSEYLSLMAECDLSLKVNSTLMPIRKCSYCKMLTCNKSIASEKQNTHCFFSCVNTDQR